jgi:hypothetical protein
MAQSNGQRTYKPALWAIREKAKADATNIMDRVAMDYFAKAREELIAMIPLGASLPGVVPVRLGTVDGKRKVVCDHMQISKCGG